MTAQIALDWFVNFHIMRGDYRTAGFYARFGAS